MKRELASGILSVSLVLGGALAGAAIVTKDGGDATRTKGSDRAAAASQSPQDVISEDGVNRIFGGNRFATAAAISQHYGWDENNTIAVYIASGQDYPDALAIGLTNFGDGPLLLVNPGNIPTATRNELTRLQPCFIDVLGGTGAVSLSVFNALKSYADPSLCN